MAAAEDVLSAGTGAWRLGAAELHRAYSGGALSPVEVLDDILARSERINPGLNAIVAFDETARAAARDSEARRRKGDELGPLDGVPLTVKDNIPVRGLRSTWGTRVYAAFVPDRDELAVARLRAKGAVIFGKTNVPEFTLQGYTDNLLFGPTRNPWDLRLTPGGSSGGAAAAVAAGLGPLAVGTDGGGSIRRPASHTGLVGLKPTVGRVPRVNGFPVILHDFEVVGPIARTAADAALLLAAMAGPDARDRASLAFADFSADLSQATARQRILFVPRFGASPVDPEIAARVAEAARRLEHLGHAVDEGPVPFDLDALDRAWSVIGPAGLAWLLRDREAWREALGPALRQTAETGFGLTAADYVEALDHVARLRASLGETLGHYDLILTPTAAALPWPAEVSHPAAIDGTPVGPRGHAVFTAFANAGGLPGVSLPCEPSANGLPIGFQLVGRFGADELLLQIAAQYEAAHPWADRRPPLA